MFFILPIVGVIFGILGIGAGIIMLPLFTLLYDLTFTSAVNLTLLTTSLMALVGIIININSINYKIGIKYFLFSSIGAFIGSIFSTQIPDMFKEVVFLSIIIYVLLINPKTNSKNKSTFAFIMLTITTGLLTSIIGVGGGFLILPILIYFFNLTIKEAIQTSFFIVFLNTFTSLLFNIYLNNNSSELLTLIISNKYELSLLIIFFIFGRFLSKKISENITTKLYKSLLIISAGLTIYN